MGDDGINIHSMAQELECNLKPIVEITGITTGPPSFANLQSLVTDSCR